MCRKHVDFSCPLSRCWWPDTQSTNKTANTDLMQDMYAQIVLLNAPSWMPLVHSKSWITLPSSGSFGAWQWHSGVSSDYEPYGALWILMGDAAPPKSEALAKGDKDISWASAPTAKVQGSTLLLYSNKQRCWETRKCHQLGTKNRDPVLYVKTVQDTLVGGPQHWNIDKCVCVCFLCLQHSIYCRFLFQHQE